MEDERATDDEMGALLSRANLARVRGNLDAATAQLLGRAPPLDLLAEDLRLAQNALGEITGAFGADDLLGVIFSRFCIGK